MVFARAHGPHGHARRRKPQRQRLADIGFVGRQKQVRPQRLQIAERIAPLREHPALYAHAGRRHAAKHAHAAGGVVAGKHHHFDALMVRLIESQQLLDQ